MRIVFFGRLAEAIAPEVDMELGHGITVAKLREALAARYPAAAEVLRSRRSSACVDHALVPDEHRLRPTDSVEFLPPVSGG